MRRLLIILLLTILPLQAALAAACAYCPDSCASESVTSAASEVDAPDAAALAHDDCSRCQLGGAGMLPSPALSHGTPSLYQLGLPDSGSFPASGKPDRPERPKWDRAA
jgi:hypothetical protein